MEHISATDAPPRDLDDEDYDYTPQQPVESEPPPQVSSYIAIIRIVSVLIIGVCVSFGLFMTLIGVKGLIIGIPLIALAVPVYYAMQFAEKLAGAPAEEDGDTAARGA